MESDGHESSALRGSEPIIEIRDLSKSFGAITALDGVTLQVAENEVLGLVGDNGAGKSTLLSLLTGYRQPDRGAIFYRGKRVSISSPAHSRKRLHVEMIYQDLAVASDLTVWENLFLGQELRRGPFLDVRSMRKEASAVLERLGASVAPTDLVSEISGGERQLVAVARALLFDREILLMDEPTAAVSAAKAEEVLQLISNLQAQGKTVVLISHRLEDVLRVCNRVAVLAAGRLAHFRSTKGLDVGTLAHLMFGTYS